MDKFGFFHIRNDVQEFGGRKLLWEEDFGRLEKKKRCFSQVLP
jgi:hypothetical protein